MRKATLASLAKELERPQLQKNRWPNDAPSSTIEKRKGEEDSNTKGKSKIGRVHWTSAIFGAVRTQGDDADSFDIVLCIQMH
jgi:hypothetical protein